MGADDSSALEELPTLADIEAAAKALAAARDERGGPAIVETPTLYSRVLSDHFDGFGNGGAGLPADERGIRIYVKHENMQVTASYKERGALNKLLALDRRGAGRPTRVVAASAGNHAQGVACHARRLGFEAIIYMPVGTPANKVTRTRGHGAIVEIVGDSFDACRIQAQAFAREDSATEFVHPFDDPAIIAGQGTVALEMLRQLGDPEALDTLVVPIGGGGLISGMAIAAKAMNPGIRIVGVEAELFPTLYNSRRPEGERLPIGGDTIAEGIQVRDPGELTARIVNARGPDGHYLYVDDILLVHEDWIEEAIGRLVELEKTVVEGAGAVGLAALLQYRDQPGVADRYFKKKRVGIVLSGGNIDTRLLSNILIRDLLIEKRMARISIVLKDRPGELVRALGLLSAAQINIVDIVQDRQFNRLPAKNVAALIDCEADDESAFTAALVQLGEDGFDAKMIESRDLRRGKPSAG